MASRRRAADWVLIVRYPSPICTEGKCSEWR
jgi:hypothetical protein